MNNLSPISLSALVLAFTTIAIPEVANAQNWEPVYFSETANYTVEGYNSEVFVYMYPFDQDGEIVTGRFLPNLTAEAPCVSGGINAWNCTDSCKVATNPFLQEYAVFMPSGVVEFQYPDTFRIHCQAQLGDGWIYGTDSSDNEVFAAVTDQYEGTVLGVTDSIKVITVDDGTIIHLSKHHGITLWSDVELNYSLSSIPARNLGASLLTKADVFDFNVGDVFVYLHLSENGIEEPPLDSQSELRQIVRNDVVNVDEVQDTIFISLHTTVFTSSYTNWNGSVIQNSAADTLTSILKIAMVDNCLIYNWPVDGAKPSHIPSEIDLLLVSLVPMGETCNSNFTYNEDCTETAFAGNYLSATFNVLTTDQFDNHAALSTSMNLYGGTVLDANSNALDVINQDPRTFYEWQNLAKCESQSGESINNINIGDAFFAVTENDFIGFTQVYALGEGLGLVAYDFDYYGLGGYCRDRMVMVGYHKSGADPQGFVPGAAELITLSSNDVSDLAPLNIYPNPASTTLHLHLPGGTLTRASLHDMQGRQVLEVQLKPSAPALDVSNLPKGMYLLRANGQNGAVYTQKLIVQ